MSIWSLLARLNKVLLPSIYTTPDLTRLSGFQKAIVGWKMYVTYRHLDALEGRGQSPLEGDKLRH
tara:strand:+ start:462 stop:656 length:195 start_codon:yes stop_codon:yes gene_type:complete